MIFITGDTHGLLDFDKLRLLSEKYPTATKNDFLIIAGDFGGVWNKNSIEEDLKPFTDLPVTVLFIDGNHENFDLLNSYPIERWNGGKVHRIKPDIIHLMRGQVFDIDNKTIFTFGGATSIDRYNRVEGKNWWVQELPTYEELDEGLANLKLRGNKVDYIITHSCSQRALQYTPLRIVAGIKLLCPEGYLLSNFESDVDFKHWYFGHFHIDKQLSDKYTALYQNVVKLM